MPKVTKTARLQIRVQPGARRNGFAGWYGDLPRVAVTAPPVDGAANDAVLVVVAAALGLRPSQLRLLSGHTSRTKRLEVDGLDAADIEARILNANPRPGAEPLSAG